MTNTSAAAGFQVVGQQGVGAYTGAMKKVAFASGDATAAFLGSMVKYTGASVTVNGEVIPVVTLASPADTKLAGAIQYFDPQRSGSWTTFNRTASTQVIGYIPADPYAYYQVQEDSVGGNISLSTNIGNNCDFTAESGSTVTGYSTMQLDSSTAANTNTLPLRLVAPAPRADNDSTSANATWIVTIIQSAYTNLTGAN
jgi:hypothetical protein